MWKIDCKVCFPGWTITRQTEAEAKEKKEIHDRLMHRNKDTTRISKL